MRFRLLATGDVHGWLEPWKNRAEGTMDGGLAELAAAMREEGLGRPDVLLLDSGDMWTGPAASTLLAGEPMVEAYNAMGYRAAAVGNHEFDFGLDVLELRAKEATFPLLAANLGKADGSAVPWARPYVMAEVAGAKIGVVGLALESTPTETQPRNVSELRFTPYGRAIDNAVKQVREAGAEAVLAVGHVPLAEITPVLEMGGGFGLVSFIAGHKHVPGTATISSGLVAVNPGPYGRSFAVIDLEVEAPSGKRLSSKVRIRQVRGTKDAPAPKADYVAKIVARANEKTAARTKEFLAEAPDGLARGSPDGSPMGHLLCDAWLGAVPNADFALTNLGGIRQSIAPGAITVGDVMSALPFDNRLLVVRLRGEQLRAVLAAHDEAVIGGFVYRFAALGRGARKVVDMHDARQKRPLEDDRVYRVITTDYLYHGGEGYPFKDLDPDPYDTGIGWRDPLLAVLRERGKKREPVRPPREPRALPAD